MSSPQEELSAAILAILGDLRDFLQCPVPDSLTLERPKNRDHGDYATSIALALAKPSGKAPREIASRIQAALATSSLVAAVDIAGPGFINITLASSGQASVIAAILNDGSRYGHSNTMAGVKVNLEFISANPTGPLHLGHTRWAAVGDSLGRVLSAAGAQVAREFYINDRGNQMELFGASIRAVALGIERPADGYLGEYIVDLATQVVAQHPQVLQLEGQESIAAFRDYGYALQLKQQQDVLDAFGTHFDIWFSEKSLYENDFFNHSLQRLRDHGHVYEKEGATWMRTTDFGDD